MKNSFARILTTLVLMAIAFGAGKMSNPTEETTKTSSELKSSATTVASTGVKKSESSEEKKSTLKALTYYPNGQLKSSVEKSVESVEKRYEQEITELKIQIKLLESRSMVEHTVKYSCPTKTIMAFGGIEGEKLIGYSQQFLLPNLSLGGAVMNQQGENKGLIGGSFSF